MESIRSLSKIIFVEKERERESQEMVEVADVVR